MGLPFLLAIALPALGQPLDWHTTDIGTPGGPYPVGASVRVWGPTGEVFLLRHEHELLDAATGEPYRQAAWLEQWRCDPETGCAEAEHEGTWPIGTIDEGNHMVHPSMAVRDMGPVRRLTIVRATHGYRYACPSLPDGKTQWDLAAFTFDSGRGVVATMPLEVATGPEGCTDWGRLEVQQGADGVAWACYTHADETAGDRVRCRRQSHALRWSAPLDLPRRWEADHPSFALLAGRPLVVVHETEGTDHRMRLHGPAADRRPIDFDAGDVVDRRKNYPSIASAGGHVVVAYEAGSDATPQVWLRSCDAGAGCTDYEADSPDDAWHEATFVGQGDMAFHPQVAIDPAMGRLFLLTGTNVAANPHTQSRRRLQLATRCLATPDAPFELHPLPAPYDDDHDQVIGFGRPAFELDTVRRTLHVAAVEATTWEGRMPDLDDPATDATLRWMRASYAAMPSCPSVD